MNDFGPAVRKILRENGCWLHRQGKGDHEIWLSPLSKIPITVDQKINRGIRPMPS